jgi:hypothetical protein
MSGEAEVKAGGVVRPLLSAVLTEGFTGQDECS